MVKLKSKRVFYATFYSPGSFASETTEKKISTWNIKKALVASKKVVERYNAKPYAFKLSEYEEYAPIKQGDKEFKADPAHMRTSGFYYITGVVSTLDEIPDTEDNQILRSNMRCGDYAAIVNNYNSYRFTGIFSKEDFVVDLNGKIIAKGSDYYPKKKKKKQMA